VGNTHPGATRKRSWSTRYIYALFSPRCSATRTTVDRVSTLADVPPYLFRHTLFSSSPNVFYGLTRWRLPIKHLLMLGRTVRSLWVEFQIIAILTYSAGVVSARQYADLVYAHAKQSTAESLQPGQNYENLSQHLQQPYQSRQYPENSERLKRVGDAGFAILYDLGVDGPQGITVTMFHRVDSFDEIQHLGATENGHIIYLRGNPTPEWRNTIGYKCNVDPEFYLRHLNFRSVAGKPDYFHFQVYRPPTAISRGFAGQRLDLELELLLRGMVKIRRRSNV
jgi:hypothetical protein